MAQVVLSPIGKPLCAWTQGSRKFAIQVHPDVLARLGMEVRVAFKRVPRRGLEIGGILVGRIDYRDQTTTFWIEGFESVDSEHRSGPSYILSESDFALLREALTRNGAASIGIYRSQTRSQRLELQEPDVKLFERCFDRGDVLFLIACPAAGKAAFFIREGGELKCVHEFGLGSPLGPSVAAPSVAGPSVAGPSVAAPSATGPSVTAPSVAPQSPPSLEMFESTEPPAPPEMHTALLAVPIPIHSAEEEYTASDPVPLAARSISPWVAIERWRPAIDHSLVKPMGGWFRRSAGSQKGPWLAVAVILSAVLGAGIGMLSHARPASVPSATAQPLPAEDLHLTVEGNGALLRLHWDQGSSAARNPKNAVLRIQDGDYQMVRNLTPSEFGAGSVAYEPRTHNVAFRVEVSSPTTNASGYVQVVNLSAPSVTTPSATTPPRPPEPLPAAPARYPATVSPRGTSPARFQSAAPVLVAKEPEKTAKEETPPPAIKSSEGNEAASVPKRADSPAIDLDKQPQPAIVERPTPPLSVPEPSVRVWTEAVAGSSWGRLVGKVPLVRRFGNSGKASPPAPILQVQPVLTNSAKQSITQPVSVDVRVDIGVSGMVDSAEVIEFSDPFNGALVNSALAAAVRWTFEPARADHLAVSSRVILHFRFAP